MHNFKSYDISDAAQPAYKYKNNAWINPAYPSVLSTIEGQEVSQNESDILSALRQRLKRARKKNDQRKIRAVKALLKEIQGDSYGK